MAASFTLDYVAASGEESLAVCGVGFGSDVLISGGSLFTPYSHFGGFWACVFKIISEIFKALDPFNGGEFGVSLKLNL